MMEDARRPFTPLIQPESPTPESSQSPGRGSKKPGSDSSISPTRRTNARVEPAKDGKGAPGKAQPPALSKKLSNPKEVSMDKGGARKGKDLKAPSVELDDATPTQKSKERELMDASSKLNQHEPGLDDFGQTARSDSQTQMRAESSLSHHAPSTITETGYVPFSVEPSFGKIEPGKTQTFKVKFAPLNVNEYVARLVCHIPNLEEDKAGAIVPVKGRGLLPYCHFELEESDYIISGRRNPDLPGPGGAASGLGLDPMTKVIEFNCVGIETKCVKRFEIINPTNADYEFEWRSEEHNDGKNHDQFTCSQVFEFHVFITLPLN